VLEVLEVLEVLRTVLAGDPGRRLVVPRQRSRVTSRRG
jgi:hypothetical protein